MTHHALEHAAAAWAARFRLPTRCAVCRGWGSGRICELCQARFAPSQARCLRCAIELRDGSGGPSCVACLIDPPPYQRSWCAVRYAFPWDGLIARFKFDAALDLAPALVELMQRVLRAGSAPGGTLLVPVPLSAERLRERGFNQAWELARRLARATGSQADARLLLRIRDSPHQVALPRAERIANVRAAFAVEPTRRRDLAGRDVTLVDDVMTTGATAAEATRELLRAGARTVSVAVFARTPGDDG
jgi:ComF family protein